MPPITIRAKLKSFDELRDLTLEGINTFWSRTYAKTFNRGEYSNKILTDNVINHSNSITFINGVKDAIKEYLKINYGKIDNLEIIDKSTGEIYKILLKNDVSSPKFDDNFSGLRIAINDTWDYDVMIIKFEIYNVKKRYLAILEIELFDHYGLDSLDVDPQEKPDFAKDSGFRSWFYLQHSKKHNLTPFITVIKFKKYIYGKY